MRNIEKGTLFLILPTDIVTDNNTNLLQTPRNKVDAKYNTLNQTTIDQYKVNRRCQKDIQILTHDPAYKAAIKRRYGPSAQRITNNFANFINKI